MRYLLKTGLPRWPAQADGKRPYKAKFKWAPNSQASPSNNLLKAYAKQLSLLDKNTSLFFVTSY